MESTIPPEASASAAPAKPAAAPLPAPPAAGPGGEVMAMEDGSIAVHIGFWQQPWVQNILPFATSLVLHVGLIALGYATFKTVQYVTTNVQEEQVIIPDATLAESGPPGGIINPGTGGDPTRRAEQNIDETVSQSDGWAQKKGASLQASLAGGGAGDSDGEAVIGIGAGTFGAGSGKGSGSGEGFGVNSGGDGSGMPAPFGTPGGGGGIGPKAPFAGVGGNARKIVYLCDASGSMHGVFPSLKEELKRSVSGLVAGQFFNVILFRDEQVMAFNKSGLIMANPDNKTKLYGFIDDATSTGGTNPIPAIQQAFANKPQLMYVLTDGFDNVDNFELVYKEFDTHNKDKKVKVNCILLFDADKPDQDKALRDILERIAKDNGGILKVVDKNQFGS